MKPGWQLLRGVRYDSLCPIVDYQKFSTGIRQQLLELQRVHPHVTQFEIGVWNIPAARPDRPAHESLDRNFRLKVTSKGVSILDGETETDFFPLQNFESWWRNKNGTSMRAPNHYHFKVERVLIGSTENTEASPGRETAQPVPPDSQIEDLSEPLVPQNDYDNVDSLLPGEKLYDSVGEFTRDISRHLRDFLPRGEKEVTAYVYIVNQADEAIGEPFILNFKLPSRVYIREDAERGIVGHIEGTDPIIDQRLNLQTILGRYAERVGVSFDSFKLFVTPSPLD